ncbi:MAG: GGDEF domain-containing protein [Geobacteraceae bacterium]|nr:GGDEF domain-containing protein [Geobacteraceae bacterium]
MNSAMHTSDCMGQGGFPKRVGGRLGQLVENVCDVMGMRRNLKEMAFLSDFCRIVSSSLITEEVLASAARRIYDYFHYNLLVVLLQTGAEERIMAFTPRDMKNSSEELEVIMRNYSGLRAHDVKDYRYLGLDGPTGSLIFGNTDYLELPMNLGSVTVYSEFNFVSHFSENMLQGLMEILAAALRNSIDYGKIKDLSMRDGLTGLFNRRVLEEMLELEGRRREVAPFSLLVVDVDNFKLINDTYGHPAGDMVLQMIARILRESTRGSDIVARSGGEEFSIMLPAVSPSGAVEIGERIRNRLSLTTVTYNGKQIRVTASVGISHRSSMDPCTVRELVSRTDQALYEAKRSGKNRVCVFQVKSGTASEKCKSGDEKRKQVSMARVK